MQYLIVTALLAALAAAAPAAQKQRIFGLTALRSASPIHFREINANGEGFWIGKPTKTYCPKEPGLPCPPNTNTTLFSQYGSTTGLGLDTEVPAGQEAFINATNGALAFNIAHTSVPEDAITTPFTYTADPNAPPNGFLLIPGGALACPFGNDVYKIFSDKHYNGKVKKADCLGFDLFATPTKANPVWQYE